MELPPFDLEFFNKWKTSNSIVKVSYKHSIQLTYIFFSNRNVIWTNKQSLMPKTILSQVLKR